MIMYFIISEWVFWGIHQLSSAKNEEGSIVMNGVGCVFFSKIQIWSLISILISVWRSERSTRHIYYVQLCSSALIESSMYYRDHHQSFKVSLTNCTLWFWKNQKVLLTRPLSFYRFWWITEEDDEFKRPKILNYPSSIGCIIFFHLSLPFISFFHRNGRCEKKLYFKLTSQPPSNLLFNRYRGPDCWSDKTFYLSSLCILVKHFKIIIMIKVFLHTPLRSHWIQPRCNQEFIENEYWSWELKRSVDDVFEWFTFSLMKTSSTLLCELNHFF